MPSSQSWWGSYDDDTRSKEQRQQVKLTDYSNNKGRNPYQSEILNQETVMVNCAANAYPYCTVHTGFDLKQQYVEIGKQNSLHHKKVVFKTCLLKETYMCMYCDPTL